MHPRMIQAQHMCYQPQRSGPHFAKGSKGGTKLVRMGHRARKRTRNRSDFAAPNRRAKSPTRADWTYWWFGSGSATPVDVDPMLIGDVKMMASIRAVHAWLGHIPAGMVLRPTRRAARGPLGPPPRAADEDPRERVGWVGPVRHPNRLDAKPGATRRHSKNPPVSPLLHFPRKPIGEQAPADEISPPHLRVRKLPQPGSVR